MNDIKIEDAGDNLALWNRVRTVPGEFLKKITGGRLAGKSDINPTWRLQTLTEMFGPCGIGWYYETIHHGKEDHAGEVSYHVRINLFVKVGGEWSKPIEGQGGSMLLEKQKSGDYHSDECVKMATTDAISVACKQLGIGADVYLGRMDSKYSAPVREAQVDLSKHEAKLNAAKTMDELAAAWTLCQQDLKGQIGAIDKLIPVKESRKNVLRVADVFQGEQK